MTNTSSNKSDEKDDNQPSYRRLTEPEWEQACLLWERGEATLRELSEKFGITKANIHIGLKQRGSVKNARIAEVRREIEEAATDDAAEKRLHIRDLKKRYDNYADFIGKSLMKKIIDVTKANNPLTTIASEVNVLKNASTTIKNVRDELWEINGLYDDIEGDEVMEDLIIGVMTEEDEAMIRQLQEERTQHGTGSSVPDFGDFDEDFNG